MEVEKDDLVLDLLNRVKWEHDGSFSYRRSCRHGICGACAIKVNGKATLACKQNAMELLDLFNNELVFEPSSKKRSIKDMIIDKVTSGRSTMQLSLCRIQRLTLNQEA